MIPERMVGLLQATAAGLRVGEPPLGHAFLVEHDVTLDEAYNLADWLAAGIGALLELDKTPPGCKLIGVALAESVIAGGVG